MFTSWVGLQPRLSSRALPELSGHRMQDEKPAVSHHSDDRQFDAAIVGAHPAVRVREVWFSRRLAHRVAVVHGCEDAGLAEPVLAGGASKLMSTPGHFVK